MHIEKTAISGVFVFTPKLWQDERGWFQESYSIRELANYNISANFIQDNHSFSEKAGTLRGIHFQAFPKSQTKLLRCTRGAVEDIVIDIRKNSPTFLKWISVELSASNRKQLYMPKGLAHGVLSLADYTEIQYKVDEEFLSSCERGIYFDDPTLNIAWRTTPKVISTKDASLPSFLELNHSDFYCF